MDCPDPAETAERWQAFMSTYRYYESLGKNKLTMQFIARSMNKHGPYMFTYHESEFVHSTVKVITRCRMKHKVEQLPHSHYAGSGCRTCYEDSLRMSISDFIFRAKRVHGPDTFDYSRVVYFNNNTKVIITCRTKGHILNVTPDHHLRGDSCDCYRTGKVKTTDEFIRDAIGVHGHLFDYSRVIYADAHSKVHIICAAGHGFMQAPSNHLKGHGCYYCSGNHVRSLEEFIEDGVAVHGANEFDYSEVVYINASTKVILTCRYGHTFQQVPYSHTRGVGCKRCSEGRRFSKVSVQWLNFISMLTGMQVEHAGNEHGEFAVPGTKYMADGYIRALKRILEFHGCYWHGCPICYPDPRSMNTKMDMPHSELYSRTLRKAKLLREAGYDYECIWGCEWTRLMQKHTTSEAYRDWLVDNNSTRVDPVIDPATYDTPWA